MSDKALLLGINSYKSVSPLRGCINDVENMRQLLVNVYGFKQANVRRLLNSEVIKSNVKSEMDWLFQDVKPNDRLVLHFSGHGSQVADVDGDEDEGYDEILCLHDMDFKKPNTYLVDDEIRKWTEGLPTGAKLTIVFDSCHSGSATRMLLAPGSGRGMRSVMVDLKVSADRAGGAARGLNASEILPTLSDPTSPDSVRLRFIEPPADVLEAIEQKKRNGVAKRGLVTADLNHVFLAGCKSNQTSADAHIENDFHGAFTFHLCKTIREGGAQLDRKVLIKRVENALTAARFAQSPQLETSTDKGPLFGVGSIKVGSTSPEQALEPSKTWQPTDGIDEQSNLATMVGLNELMKVLPAIASLAPDAQVEILRLCRQLCNLNQGPLLSRDSAAQRHLVYVHGICRHEPHYSDDWWNAMKRFVSVFGQGTLGTERHEVIWSDLVNARDLEETAEQQEARLSLIEVMQDRMDREQGSNGDTRELDTTGRGLEVPYLNCLDDFTVYMVDSGKRAQIIKRFTDVVKPLLDAGAIVDIIAHSWGTVVAYEGLRELALSSNSPGRVQNLFTAGAALSIGPVKQALRLANKDGRRPENVNRWINLNARGDIVGGVLKGRPYQVDADFPNLAPFNCTTLFGSAINPACAHRSYFVDGNDVVNRDIFAAFINRS